MNRREFTKETKRAALQRSGDLCEATGVLYGLPAGSRCNAPLKYGVRFEHVIIEANSHDASLENCACVCMVCWRYKTRTHDLPTAAKTLRQQDNDCSIGEAPSHRPMPCGRNSSWKRKIGTGRTVPRYP